MSFNPNDYAPPESPSNFNETEKKRWNKNLEDLIQKLRKEATKIVSKKPVVKKKRKTKKTTKKSEQNA
jgi:hypothetical protein